MSMPNRFCVIERRLDIIEAKLGIENSDAELNRQVVPMKEKWTLCPLHTSGDPDYPKEQCSDCTFALVGEGVA